MYHGPFSGFRDDPSAGLAHRFDGEAWRRERPRPVASGRQRRAGKALHAIADDDIGPRPKRTEVQNDAGWQIYSWSPTRTRNPSVSKRMTSRPRGEGGSGAHRASEARCSPRTERVSNPDL